MPRNTTQLGNTGWRRFVFEGVTPDSTIPINPSEPSNGNYRTESRIEIATLGATNIIPDSMIVQTTQNFTDTLTVNKLLFENNLNIDAFMITQFRISDISESIPDIDDQQEDRSIVNGGVVWTRTYDDDSKDLIVYNPLTRNCTIEGITSNAKVWLLHADDTGNWANASLYGTSTDPSFSGYSPIPTVNTHTTAGSGVQYEITF